MKKIIRPSTLFTLTLLLSLVGCKSTSNSYRYKIEEHNVYWVEPAKLNKRVNVDYKIQRADPNSFQTFADIQYAKDKNYAYYYGKPIPFAKGRTFDYIGAKFYRDENHVYYWKDIISGAEPDKFKLISGHSEYGDSLAKDDEYVYINDKKFKPCHISTITPVYNLDAKHHYNWLKDDECVYYEDKLIDGADPFSFKALNMSYSLDIKYVYYENRIVPGADPKTFKAYTYRKKFNGKDENSCYIRAQNVDCDEPKVKRIHSKKFKNEAELNKAASKLASSWLDKNDRLKSAALEKQSDNILNILNYLGEHVLTPLKAKKINLSTLPTPFSFTMYSTELFPKEFTYVLNKKDETGVVFDIYNSKVYGVMYQKLNLNGQITEESKKSMYSFSDVRYSTLKCQFIVGQCKEKSQTVSPRGKEYISTMAFYLSFENGVWIKEVIGNTNKIIELFIYDNFGLPVYNSKSINGKLIFEFVRSDYKNSRMSEVNT